MSEQRSAICARFSITNLALVLVCSTLLVSQQPSSANAPATESTSKLPTTALPPQVRTPRLPAQAR